MVFREGVWWDPVSAVFLSTRVWRLVDLLSSGRSPQRRGSPQSRCLHFPPATMSVVPGILAVMAMTTTTTTKTKTEVTITS